MNDSISRLLEAAEGGDPTAHDRLFTLLYDELRRCAHRQLGGSAQTMSTTALVNETYLKLVSAQTLKLGSRQHFMALAARAMRQVMVDQARAIGASKRGGDQLQVTLDEHIPDTPAEALEVLALDQALGELEKIDERAARVVQLHFFGGLTFGAIGELEGLNERTIKRDWEAARRMLALTMSSAL